MYREEFLSSMEEQMEGKMKEGKIAAHLRYYEDYIQSHVRGGENEEDVIAALGDPRLIARTLVDTDDGSEIYEEDTSDHYKSYSQEYEEESPGRLKDRSHVFDLSTTSGKVIAAVLVIAVLYLFFRLLTAALPFLLVLAVILFVIRKVRDR